MGIVQVLQEAHVVGRGAGLVQAVEVDAEEGVDVEEVVEVEEMVVDKKVPNLEELGRITHEAGVTPA